MRRGGRRPNSATTLVGESLEMRLTLDGTVDVVLAGTTLTLTGDIDANDVLISPGTNPHEILIEGKDRDGNVTTLINGPTLIDHPVDVISVDLLGGSDDFRIVGNSPQDRFVVTGSLLIENDDGDNVNRLENVLVAAELTVVKAGGISESTLEVVATVVVGEAAIANSVGGQGPSKTLIASGSTFQDDLTVVNGDGSDIFVIDNSNVDGDLVVSNGDGDTRTVFGMSEDPIVYGELTIVNGDGNDTVVINDTDVWGPVTIANDDGNTETIVANARVALGEPAAAGNTVFTLINAEGTDSLLMTESLINDGIDIVNGNAGQTGGSTIEISDSTVRGNLLIFGDDGQDRVTIDPTTVGRNLDVILGNGGSDVAFAELTVGGILTVVTDQGKDSIVLVQTTVSGDVDLLTGEGVDRVEILAGSKLLGQTELISGDGVDTLLRQVAPEELAVDIAFLLFEDFELDLFLP